MEPSPIWTEVDYERPGRQYGYLGVPQSTNSAGWATLFVPIIVIKGGPGPTALLFGGNHGDEFEGPVTLLNLARELDPEQVQGRIIMVPALNLPAVQAGSRLSPLDGKNMNRAFPGSPNDSVTGQIAHYVASTLLPLADLVLDLHSGGRSMHFLPSVNMHRVADTTQMQAMLRAGIAFGAPYVFLYRDVAGSGLLPSYAESLGKVTLGTELGSASQFTPEILAIAARGVRNLLALYAILPALPPAAGSPPQVVESDSRDDYVMAPATGIYEPFLDLGAPVTSGQPLGQIHIVEHPEQPAIPVVARTNGLLMSRRAFPRTGHGECVAVVSRVVAEG